MKVIRSFVINHASALLVDRGVDPEMVARIAGVPTSAIFDPNIELDGNAVMRFFDFSLKASGDPDFILDLARHHGMESLGMLWIMAQNAKTLGESFRILADNLSAVTSAFTLAVEKDEAGLTLSVEFFLNEVETGHASELVFAVICREIRNHAGSNWRPLSALFRHKRVGSMGRRQKEFGRSVHYQQDRDMLYIDRSTAEISLDSADLQNRLLELDIRAADNAVGPVFVSRVESLISGMISSEQTGIEEVADRLCVSVRTLQLRLASQGETYSGLVQSVREHLGSKYLKDSDLQINQVAERLGFADTSAFSRFFRNRTGQTPRQFRSSFRNFRED